MKANEPRRVAIIGAGIVGVATAIHLLRAGQEVILIDKVGPGEGASFGNGGVLAVSSVVPVTVPGLAYRVPGMLLDRNSPLFVKWRRLPGLVPWLLRYLGHTRVLAARRRAAAVHPLIVDSLGEHRALAHGTDARHWIAASDYLYLYKGRADFERDGFGWGLRKELGIDWETLEGDDVIDYDPALSPRHRFAVRLPDHGIILDPGRYVKALAAFAQQNGASMVIGTAHGIARRDGRVTGVHVDSETIASDAVLIAAGAWSTGFVRDLGLRVPLESERGYHIELWEPSLTPRSPVMVTSGKFVITPMEGRLRLAGIAEFGGLEAPPTPAAFALLLRQAREALPMLTWRKTTQWMGHRPSMADSIPVIGKIPGVEGAFAGFGHDHIGLTAGPATGKILAQLICEQIPNLDLTPYAPARFKAGS